MSMQLIDNLNIKLIDIVRPAIQDAIDAKFAVSFVKQSGFSMIQDSLANCLQNGAHVEFLLGLDFQITEAEALRTILEMARVNNKVKCYCYMHTANAESAVYHPKLYMFNNRTIVSLIIGSSNLTKGGLEANVEVNIAISASFADEIISDAYSVYNRLKFLENRFEPDFEFIESYGQISKRVQQRSRRILEESSIRVLLERLREKERTLPKPEISSNDLVGWQKIVYERLPSDNFTTGYLYTFEREFQQFYPQNQNIRAKIRQILQQLRDLKLIRHPTTNRWERL